MGKKRPSFEKEENCGGVERLEEEKKVAWHGSHGNNFAGADLERTVKMGEGRRSGGNHFEERRGRLHGCCCCSYCSS